MAKGFVSTSKHILAKMPIPNYIPKEKVKA
jgi:hypothetical protein